MGDNYNLCMDRLRKYKAQAIKQAKVEFPDHPNPQKAACIAAVESLSEIMTNAWGKPPMYALEAMRDFMKEHQAINQSSESASDTHETA